jgi:hypothetical protein
MAEKAIEDMKKYFEEKLNTIMKLCGICTKCQVTKLVVSSAGVFPPPYYCPLCDKVLPQPALSRASRASKATPDETQDETLDLSMLDST